jgi:peptide chain release factor 3
VHLFERTEHGAKRAPVRVTDVRDPAIAALSDEYTYREFIDGLELLEGAGEGVRSRAMLRGDSTPVFFGSAVTNFGVQLFLDAFLEMAPAPRARLATRRCERSRAGRTRIRSILGLRLQDPSEHGSAPPRPRGVLRVCSGRFERDMLVRNVRTGKEVR